MARSALCAASISDALADVPASTTFKRTWAFDAARRADIAEMSARASPSTDPAATVK
jgi:hypothetical protein